MRADESERVERTRLTGGDTALEDRLIAPAGPWAEELRDLRDRLARLDAGAWQAPAMPLYLSPDLAWPADGQGRAGVLGSSAI